MKKKRNNKKIIIIIIALIAVAVVFGIKNAPRTFDDGVDIVCLDAGHGGSDAGAVAKGETRLEKDDNLALTLKVKEKLESQGIKVVLTRDDDSDVSLKERCRIANRKNCDLFIAIHRNSAENTDAKGIEAWISNTAGVTENKIAKATVEGICNVTGQPNRGVKRGYRDSAVGNYYVNSKTKMPSFLLEVGFITNDSENEIFDSRLDDCAEAIADAVVNIFFS